MPEISAIGIKNLFYGDVITSAIKPYTDGDPTSGLSAKELKDFLALQSTKEVKNIHGDNWNYEEPMPSVTDYTNKLAGGSVYRTDVKNGIPKMSLTIGKYDFVTKAAFQGGNANETKYSAPTSSKRVEKTMVALTEDGVYIVFPRGGIICGGTTTDNAVGLKTEAIAMEPNEGLETVAMIAKSAVDAAV